MVRIILYNNVNVSITLCNERKFVQKCKQFNLHFEL